MGPALREAVERQLEAAACPSLEDLTQEPEQAVEIGLTSILQLPGLQEDWTLPASLTTWQLVCAIRLAGQSVFWETTALWQRPKFVVIKLVLDGVWGVCFTLLGVRGRG